MAGRSTETFVVSIDRPPVDVFAYLSDVSKHAEWSPKPYRVEGASGPVTAGDTFSSIGVVPGDKEHRNEVTVLEVSPPRRLVLDAVEKDQHFVSTFDLEAEGSGTRLTRTMDSPKPGFPVSVVFPLIMAAVVKPDVRQGLANLKAKLERG
jgi:uncharacterized protein YndB with AHSA1/START domain